MQEARNALKTNQLLHQQKLDMEIAIHKAIDAENTAIREKSDLYLSGLDHEIYSTQKYYNKEIQRISIEGEKVSVSMNELAAQSAKILQIDEMMNRSDVKHEKTMNKISAISSFLNNRYGNHKILQKTRLFSNTFFIFQ